MEKDSCDVSTALEKLRDTTTKFAPQSPKSDCSEEARIECLYKALSDIDWAKSALTQCYAHEPPWDFQKQCTALDTLWLQEQRDAKKTQPTSNTMDVLFGSQPTYSNPRHGQGRFHKHYNKHFNENLLRCYKCNEPGHFSMSCPKPFTMKKTGNSFMRNHPHRANHILFEVCQQYENYDDNE